MQAKIIHQTSWARSSRGTPIELYKKTHNRDGKATAPILFVGGVHGDEPEGVRLAQEFLKWLQKTEAESLEKVLHSWQLIPCINVDGYLRNQRTNDMGVDLNRNFPSRDWSAETKGPRYYPGTHAASEAETQALVLLLETEKPKLIVHFHSWEPCVVYTGTPGKEASTILAGKTGYEVREDIGYPTPGSLGQYGWLDHKIPVICIEEQERIHLDHVWPHFELGLTQLMTTDFSI
jgi:predicted deacylase